MAHANELMCLANLYLLPQQSGKGYVSYSNVELQYGTKMTIETVQQIATDYFRNQRVELQIGDLSLQKGGSCPGHKSHVDGKCIDLRPIRKDRKVGLKTGRVTIQMDQYDREATKLLVQSLLAHENVKRILFNDQSIDGVIWYEGHDNHLHVVCHH